MKIRNIVEKHKVPYKITSRQAKLVFASTIIGNSNLFDIIEKALKSIPDENSKKLALIEWDNALHFERHSAILNDIANKLGITQEQLDDIFIKADKL